MAPISEDDLRLLVSHLPDFAVVVDWQGRYAWVNRLDPTLKLEDVIGKPVEHFVTEPDKLLVRETIGHCLRTGEAGYYESWAYANGEYTTCYGCRVVSLPPDGEGRPRALLLSSDITERRRSEDEREVMVRELDHRTKNLLTMVSAIAEQTLQRADSLSDFRETYLGRLRALGNTHRALSATRWTQLDLQRLLRATVGPVADGLERLAVGSANPTLPPKVAAPLGLALYELATNAVKHGALRECPADLELSSTLAAGPTLILRWREHGVEQAPESLRDGFGLRLIRGLVEHELGGALSLATGPDCREYALSIPLA